LGRLPALAYGAGGALLVAAVVLIVVLLTRGGGVSVLHTYTGGPVAQRVDGVSMAGAGATVQIRSDHTTRVAFSDLPALNPARAYELWFIPAKGSPVSLGGFRAGADHSYSASYTKDAAAYALVAVTIERAPGDWPTPSKYLAIAVKVTG
jgi:anti-sigma-K factor RskA